MRKTEIVPFVKWAGGKRQLLSQIQERMPENYNHYFEPFVGGGAVFFGTQPSKALINDINKALINTYQRICNSPKEFLSEVNKIDSEMWEDGKQYYYSIRERYNDKLMKSEYDVELAALFVFLNKHCFNGLYRVNGKGLFNVPYNNSRRASVEENVIWAVSEYLQNIIIHNDNHQRHQKHQPCKMDHAFYLTVYRFSPNRFCHQKYQPSSIQCRKRKKVHHSQVCRKKNCHIQQIHPDHQRSLTLGLFVSVANGIRNTHRTT